MMKNKIKEYLKDKTVLITGGTGSIGEYLVKELISFPLKKIIVFSRDEWKQYRLEKELEGFKEKLFFRIGDVRNLDSLLVATRGVDIVYHAAAMKHVPICEKNPMEAVYTNIDGAYNLREAAIRNKVSKVIAISTDKAVRSVNVMGMTKAIQERIILANNEKTKTVFIVVRFGNVVGSRGSVVPLFSEQRRKGQPITITDKRMTRFLISLKDAMELVFSATLQGKGREIFVKKMPVCKIYDLAQTMTKSSIRIIGMREGEQFYETLVSEEEMRRAKETDNYFIIYPYGTPNLPQIKTLITEYRTDLIKERMNKREIKTLLQKTGWR